MTATRAGGLFTTNFEFWLSSSWFRFRRKDKVRDLKLKGYIVFMWLRFPMQATSVEWKTTEINPKRKKVTRTRAPQGGRGDFPLIDGFSTDSECRLGLRGAVSTNLSRFQCPLADRGEGTRSIMSGRRDS